MQETLLIRTMDWVEVGTVQERTAPVVARLCALAEQAGVEVLRPRMADLIERRRQNHHFLDTQLQRLRGELDRITTASGRLRQVVPAYRGGALAGEPRLNTAA